MNTLKNILTNILNPNQMKTKNKSVELDVDFIQSRPLTPEEEKELSEYIQKLKNKKKKTHTNKAA